MSTPPTLGMRERKKLATRERIIEVAGNLFLEHGFEATTFDLISVTADVSRRTIFSYFESKEEIFLAKLAFGADLLREAVEKAPGSFPLEVAIHAVLSLATTYQSEVFTTFDELLHNTPSLRAGNRAHFESQELICFQSLVARFGEAYPKERFRLDAMLAMGTVRLALEQWRSNGRSEPAEKYLRSAFCTLLRSCAEVGSTI